MGWLKFHLFYVVDLAGSTNVHERVIRMADYSTQSMLRSKKVKFIEPRATEVNTYGS